MLPPWHATYPLLLVAYLAFLLVALLGVDLGAAVDQDAEHDILAVPRRIVHHGESIHRVHRFEVDLVARR